LDQGPTVFRICAERRSRERRITLGHGGTSGALGLLVTQERQMTHRLTARPFLSALAMLTIMGLTVAIDTYPLPVQAQTAGMTRRQDRRATRQGSRELKHECNASGQASRMDCRHAKHGMKEQGRENRW
jgi:hypothetical protein